MYGRTPLSVGGGITMQFWGNCRIRTDGFCSHVLKTTTEEQEKEQSEIADPRQGFFCVFVYWCVL